MYTAAIKDVVVTEITGPVVNDVSCGEGGRGQVELVRILETDELNTPLLTRTFHCDEQEGKVMDTAPLATSGRDKIKFILRLTLKG